MFIQLGNSLWLFDPSKAPEGALIRAKNVIMDRDGIIEVRRGSSKGSQSASGAVLYMLDVEGVRYSWVGTKCYRNETTFGDTLTAARPEAVRYNVWNSTTKSIFFVNGTDRKRVTGTTMSEWGAVAPSTAPTLEAVSTDYEVTTGAHDSAVGTWYVIDSDQDFLAAGVQIGDTLNNTTDGTSGTISWVGTITVHDNAPDGIRSDNHGNWDDGDTYTITRNLGETENDAEYKVKYTYVRKEGTTVVYESNASDAATIALSSDGDGYFTIDLDTCDASADTTMTHVRFYKTTNEGAIFYFLQDVAIADMSGDLDVTMGDDELSAKSSYHDGDHNRPPAGIALAGPFYNGYLFIGSANNLYWCKAQQPEYWPVTQYVEVSEPHDPIQRIVSYRGTGIVITREKLKQIQGSGWSGSSFYALDIESFCGTYAKNGVCVVPSIGILRVAKDGIYLYNGVDQKYAEVLDPIFEGESVDGLPNLNQGAISTCWLIQFDQNVFFGYPSTGSSYPDTVVRINMGTGKISRFDYGEAFSFVMEDKTNHRLYAGAHDGYIWQLETGTTDGGTAIDTEVESAQVSLPTRKTSPAWAKHDTYCSASDTLQADIILDGSSIEAHSLTGKDRDTRKRLITDAVGNRVSIRYSGSGPSPIIYGTQELE